MKTKFYYLLILLLGTWSLSFAQETKKMRIIIDSDQNGARTVIDTTFSSHAEMEAWMKANGHEMPVMERVPVPPMDFEIPELPEPEALPDLEELVIDIDGAPISEEDKIVMRKELEKAKVEMKKAKSELKRSKTDMEKARKELHEMHIQMERDGFEHKYTFLHDGESDGKPCDANAQVMMWVDEDANDGDHEKVYIIRITCDSAAVGEEKNIKMIRRTEEITTEPKPAPSKGPAEPEATAKPDENADHRLAANNFAVYPNPTQGKVHLAFNTGVAGTIDVKILDGTGKVVVTDQVASSDGSFDKEYTIEGKARGTYLLQLRQGEKWRHEKIVLK